MKKSRKCALLYAEKRGFKKCKRSLTRNATTQKIAESIQRFYYAEDREAARMTAVYFSK